MSQLLTRATFIVLVLGTIAAFFAAQRLKRSQPLVSGVSVAKYFSPNGDGHREYAKLYFRTKRKDRVTVSIVDQDGFEVRRLVSEKPMRAGSHHLRWDGKADAGFTVPDGVYQMRVGLRNEGRTATTPREIIVDTKPPHAVVVAVSPGWISPGVTGRAKAKARFKGPASIKSRFFVYATDGGKARLVDKFFGKRGSHEGVWDGKVAGRPAKPGNYLIAVKLRDLAGNAGTAPAKLPPTRDETEGHPGINVNYIAATAPLGVVNEGARAMFMLRTRYRSYRWRLRDIDGRKLAAGSSRSKRLMVRAPKGSFGVNILELSSHGHSSEAPLIVSSHKKRPTLLVLPMLNWQAKNPLDSNQDGWPDELGEDGKVPLKRPYLDGMPPGFSQQELPLIKWLASTGEKFSLASDYDLAHNGRPFFKGRRALVFAGQEAFTPSGLDRRLVSYLEGGGNIAILSAGSFRSGVKVTPRSLSRPTPERPSNIFGEKLREVSQPPGPIAALADHVGLFRGSGGQFGSFTELEQSQRLPQGAKLIAAAGQSSKHPALVVYRVGRALVVRTGTGQWNANLGTSVQVGQISERLWSLLSQ